MKNLKFLFALCALFTINSCVPPKFTNSPGFMYHVGFDFREYADKGFLFTPEPYAGKHTVRGMLTFHLHPEVRYLEGKVKGTDGYRVKHFFTGTREMTQAIENYKIDDLVKYIYELSIKWGGDAFTHFQHKTLTSQTDVSQHSEYPYAVVTGVVIKRH